MKTIPEIPPLSILEFLSMTGQVKVMEPITEKLMIEFNRNKFESDTHDSPHKRSWNQSMHASEFPGNSSDACPRYLAYRMMNFIGDKSMPPWVTTCGDVGMAGELSIARAWYHGGRSLGPDPDDSEANQIGFEDPEIWMTGSTDLPILLPFSYRPHIVEIKGKADDVLEQMYAGNRKWDEPHRRQLLASLALANKHDWGSIYVCNETWRLPLDYGEIDKDAIVAGGVNINGHAFYCREHGPNDCLIEIDLEPPTTGSIYYWSRSWPRHICEYVFLHDEVFFQAGRSVLAEAKEFFIEDKIPPRPNHFKWSVGACKNCKFKAKTCRDDFGRKKSDPSVTVLSQSHGVAHTKSIRSSYDPKITQQEVIDSWENARTV